MIEFDRGRAAPLLPGLRRILPRVELETPLLTQVRRGVLNTLPVLVRLAAHHRDWIREPESWRPDLGKRPRDLLVSLVEHLLLRYELPRFCENAWFIDGPLSHVERDWYCHLAQGGSLRSFRAWMPRISRRAAHEFRAAPAHFGMREALRYGQAQAVLGDSEMACAVAKSRIGLDFRNDSLWIPFFGMWGASKREPAELFLVADYLWVLAQEKDAGKIDLAGRPFPCLVRSANRFFESLAESEWPDDRERRSPDVFDSSDRSRLLELRRSRWAPMEGIRSYREEKFGWSWEVAELTSQSELGEEGRDMSHCVGNYGRRCRRGDSAVFSLRSGIAGETDLDREVTFEISRSARRLVQVKAWQNRNPHPLARRVVLDWCRGNEVDPGEWRGGG